MSLQNSDAALKAAQAQLPVAVLKTANFAASAGTSYAVDTTAGGVTATLPSSPSTGQIVIFADARGTWGSNALTVNPNGGKIEGGGGNLVYVSGGTEFSLIYIDSTRGWSVYASNSVPILVGTLAAPTGTTQVGQILTASSGAWIGSPTSYIYQWRNSPDGTTWTNISGATSSTYTVQSSDIGYYFDVLVTASNSNGSSLPAQSAATGVVIVFPPGAVAFYNFNGDLTDATGNGNNATDVHGIGYASGLLGQVLNFTDGDNIFVRLPAGLCDPGAGAMSYSLWVKFVNTGVGYQWLLCQGTGVDYTDLNPIYVEADSVLATIIASPAPGWFPEYTGLIPATGTWYQFGLTLDGIGTACQYVNGALVNSWSYTPPVVASGSQFTLGEYDAVNPSSVMGGTSFAGQMGQLGIWQRCLSSSEMATLYGSGSPPPYAT